MRLAAGNGVSELNPKLSIGSSLALIVVHICLLNLRGHCDAVCYLEVVCAEPTSGGGRAVGHTSRLRRARVSVMSRLVRTPGLESLVDIVPLELVLWSLGSCCGVRPGRGMNRYS